MINIYNPIPLALYFNFKTDYIINIQVCDIIAYIL